MNMLCVSLKTNLIPALRRRKLLASQNWAGRQHLPAFISRSVRLNIMAQKDIIHPFQTNKHLKAREYNYTHLSPGFFKSSPWMPPSSVPICVTSYSKHLALSNMYITQQREDVKSCSAQHMACPDWTVLLPQPTPHQWVVALVHTPSSIATESLQRVRLWLRTVTEAAFSK